jgi:hypothetical protein
VKATKKRREGTLANDFCCLLSLYSVQQQHSRAGGTEKECCTRVRLDGKEKLSTGYGNALLGEGTVETAGGLASTVVMVVVLISDTTEREKRGAKGRRTEGSRRSVRSHPRLAPRLPSRLQRRQTNGTRKGQG